MIVVLIPAAGAGVRMGGETPKQFLPLGGMPVLARTLRAFQSAPRVDAIVVACPAGEEEKVREIAATHAIAKLAAVVAGGASRQDSVWNALQAAPKEADLVLVHDAVRPFIDGASIDGVIDAARAYGGAVLATAVTDTIKQSDDEMFVENTLDREILWRAQTPQGFRRDLLERALKKAHHDRFVATDEASAAEFAGIDVKIVPGPPDNIKITTEFDLRVAEAVVKS